MGSVTLAIPTGGSLMANPNSGCCGGGANGDLTPLGQRRNRLPLQRKVKQLERPWKHADAGAQVTTPHHPTWASSQPVSKDGRHPGARPRTSTPVARRSRAGVGGVVMRTSVSAKSVRSTGCGTATRRRPSTGLSPSSSGLLSPAWSTSEPVRLSTTRTTDTSAESVVEPGITFVRGCGYRLDPGRRGGNEGAVGNKHPVQISTEATLTSAISPPSLLATMSVATTGPAASIAGDDGDADDKIVCAQQVGSTPSGSNNRNIDDDGEDSNSKHGPLSGSAHHHVSPADTAVGHGGVRKAAKRPNSASVSIVRASSLNPLAQRAKTDVRRPRTAGCSRGRTVDPPRLSDESAVIGRSITSASFRPDLEEGGCAAVAGWDNEGSSIECRPSVSVTLPMLEECSDTRDRRFSPGSATETATRGELGVDNRPSSRTVHIAGTGSTANCGPEALNTARWGRPGEPRRLGITIAQKNAGLDYRKSEAPRHGGEARSSRDPLLGTRAPHISALGYFIEDPRPLAAPSVSGLHGRALFGSNHRRPRSSPSRPPLPPPPAITPGEQPYGDAHPLSPTSMGSPPRRHRNSNWGEEGARLAVEEAENARQTVPFVVSGTLLGWKLSTRERKKSLEDSLKASDYSEHHLIPVYGFRCNDDDEGHEDDPGGPEEGGRRVRTMGVEERRIELRRVEARALAAERASMERRSRAEGGAGGAAFARAMSRRALARAEWIQKVGDVHDVRKENVCRGSSPEILCAYRKRVRTRLNGERLRQRTARGLPSRKPPRISAVTSRADFHPAAARNKAHAGGETATDDNNNDHGASSERGGGCSGVGGSVIQDELGREPYLMLVRARSRHSQEQELVARCGGSNRKSVASISISARFCSDCVGGCKGTCSPDGETSGRSRSCSTGIVAERQAVDS
ncbi:unnamed protein product [Ectocarpus fasciculatus]